MDHISTVTAFGRKVRRTGNSQWTLAAQLLLDGGSIKASVVVKVHRVGCCSNYVISSSGSTW